MRTATTDVEFAGSQIRKGDWIMISYARAIATRRCSNIRLSTTSAVHPIATSRLAMVPRLLGQHLGRMEMRILWKNCYPRLKSLELDGTPARTRANFVCGPSPCRCDISSIDAARVPAYVGCADNAYPYCNPFRGIYHYGEPASAKVIAAKTAPRLIWHQRRERL